MSKKETLFRKANTSSTNFTFNEICKLAKLVGFILRNISGSHHIYKHPIYGTMMNFQPDKNDKKKAKKFQIKQLIEFINEHQLMGE